MIFFISVLFTSFTTLKSESAIKEKIQPVIEAEESETEPEADNETEIEKEKEAEAEKARVAEEKLAAEEAAAERLALEQKETAASAPATSENFSNCTELRKVYPLGVPRGHAAYQFKIDRDKDEYELFKEILKAS